MTILICRNLTLLPGRILCLVVPWGEGRRCRWDRWGVEDWAGKCESGGGGDASCVCMCVCVVTLACNTHTHTACCCGVREMLVQTGDDLVCCVVSGWSGHAREPSLVMPLTVLNNNTRYTVSTVSFHTPPCYCIAWFRLTIDTHFTLHLILF